jgi:hypothetical protein
LRHQIEAASEGTAELIAVFDFGPTRTLQQDVKFGVAPEEGAAAPIEA